MHCLRLETTGSGWEDVYLEIPLLSSETKIISNNHRILLIWWLLDTNLSQLINDGCLLPLAVPTIVLIQSM